MRRPPAAVLVGALLALPLAVLAVRELVDGTPSPAGDVSLIELRTLDVGTAHNPTLGSYGRYGFNHAGPLWFYVLAVPYRVFGELELGVLVVGLLSLLAVAWVAQRLGGLWVAAALTALLVWAAGPAFVANPWEPHGLLLPCAALSLLAADTLAGRAWSLPLVAATASLLGAAQATLLPFALAMGLVAVVGARKHTRPLLAAAAVVLVLWSPTVWQQWTGDPTNLTQLREVILVDADGPSKPEGFRSVGLVDPLPPDLREERRRLLDDLGLDPDATSRDVVLAVADDPALLDPAERLRAIDDLPRFELLVSPALAG